MTIYCSMCGASNADTADFCGSCGTKIEHAAKPVSNYQQSPQNYQQPPQNYQQPPQNYQQPARGYQQPVSPYQPSRKDTGVGYIGSFFIPGFAYMYTDEAGKGIAYMLITWFLYMFVIGFFVHLYLFLTAGSVVKTWNRRFGYPE